MFILIDLLTHRLERVKEKLCLKIGDLTYEEE